MPWVRLDDNLIDHPKFVALSATAFRLWVEGLTYCQKHLTDGAIPAAVLKKLRYYSPGAVRMLLTALVPGKGPLWHQTGVGIAVHDYLEHNDGRELVLKKRDEAKERMRERRSRELHSERSANTPWGGDGSEKTLQIREGGSGETSLSQRAGVFCQWYENKHAQLFGVGYMGTNSDYMKALELCKRFSDNDLRDGAIFWFGQMDEFARKGTRTIPKFASRATFCIGEARKVRV